MQSIPAASREYVLVSVTATVEAAPYDPTGDLVEFSFPGPGADPVTWVPGSWDTHPVPGTSTFTARCLVGPGGDVTLAQGRYAVWVRITDNPEVPVRQAGLLAIT
ncbi:hypothetical protein [Peterkaempfera griseoplana]|uniref:hypothetical protein n=1 Tax=Peterkaempfera griseoplana TaxID=66896 RepID=UPI000ADC36BD|nr:hypothetical protein [Peterkaempfera griseoplana]